ncbi:unnamed protein product, partial [Discosporangium mesarthrocarpum]
EDAEGCRAAAESCLMKERLEHAEARGRLTGELLAARGKEEGWRRAVSLAEEERDWSLSLLASVRESEGSKRENVTRELEKLLASEPVMCKHAGGAAAVHSACSSGDQVVRASTGALEEAQVAATEDAARHEHELAKVGERL